MNLSALASSLLALSQSPGRPEPGSLLSGNGLGKELKLVYPARPAPAYDMGRVWAANVGPNPAHLHPEVEVGGKF